MQKQLETALPHIPEEKRGELEQLLGRVLERVKVKEKAVTRIFYWRTRNELELIADGFSVVVPMSGSYPYIRPHEYVGGEGNNYFAQFDGGMNNGGDFLGRRKHPVRVH